MNGIILTSIYFFGGMLITYLLNNNIQSNNIILYNWLGINIMINICRCLCYYKKTTICNGILYLVNNSSISIWTTIYPFYMILPWNFIILMFIYYSANVDREYMFIIDKWDTIIVNRYYYIYIIFILYGIICRNIYNLFIIFALVGQIIQMNINFTYNHILVLLILYIISILYIDTLYETSLFQVSNCLWESKLDCSLEYVSDLYNYIIYFILLSQIFETTMYLHNYYKQTKSLHSLNMNSIDFYCGKLFINRPFIYFNLLWLVIPLYIIYNIKSITM